MTTGPFRFGSDIWPGLSKVIEECGELGQAAGKLVDSGGETEYHGLDLLLGLQDELADVIAACSFVMAKNPQLNLEYMEARTQRKIEKFERYHKERADG